MRRTGTSCLFVEMMSTRHMPGARPTTVICMLALASGCGRPDQSNQFQAIELSLLTEQTDSASGFLTDEHDSTNFLARPPEFGEQIEDHKSTASPSEQTQSLEEAEFRVQGCASLFTSTVRVSGKKSQVKLNFRDERCTVYLRSFRWQGKVWKMPNGGIFAGPGKADFISTSNGSVVQVSNPRNLSPILTNQDKVSFSFKYVRLGQQGSVFEKGATGEVVSHYDSRPGPFLKWPERDTAIELSGQQLRLRLECSGRLKIAEKIRDSECVIGNASNHMQRQSLADWYFMIKEKSPDWKATLPALIFSFMTHRSGEVIKILKKEDIWQNPQTGRSGIFVNFPLAKRNGYNLESGCLKLLVLHKKRHSRVGHWGFGWFNFGLGFEGTVCNPQPDSPDGYDPDYGEDSELPSDSTDPQVLQL